MRAIVGSGLEILYRALRPFVEAELRERHGEQWRQVADAAFPGEPPRDDFDIAALLQIIERNWSTVFVSRLTQNDRSAVGELRGVRNQFVHERPFVTADVMRALDAMARVLRSIGHATEANDVARLKNGLAEPPAATKVRRTSSASTTSSRASRARASAVPTRMSAPSSSAPSGPSRALAPAAEFAPRTVQDATRPRATEGPASWAAEIDDIAQAFAGQFGRTFRTFGSPALGMLGITDAVAGVQWTCTRDLTTGGVELAVNLEGMQYDGWPVARVIERELAAAELPVVIARLAKPALITVHWMRDCWQAMSRLKILEGDIEPTPLPLDRLSAESWRQALVVAQSCLDGSRDHRGRGRQVVTTAASRTQGERDVSPHLTFRTRVALPGEGEAHDWDGVLKDAVARLEPLHAWLTDRAAA